MTAKDTKYTPTTEEVCRGYHAPDMAMVTRGDGESLGEYLSRLSIDAHKAQMFSEAAFGRWLAAHDAEVLIDARHLVIGTPGFAALTARAKEIRESATAPKGHE